MKILYFFPHNLYPPKTGAHRRGLQILAALRELGCNVTLASSTLSSETEWTPRSAQQLVTGMVDAVDVHQVSPKDRTFIRALRKFYRVSKRRAPIDNRMMTPPGMRRWFKRLGDSAAPDAIFMNYAYWDGLIDHKTPMARTRIMDTLDLVTLFGALQERLRGVLLNTSLTAEDLERVLQEDYLDKLNLRASPAEFQIFDRYTYTIGITERDTQEIKAHAPRTQARFIPMTFNPVPLDNRYDGPALFTLGPNIFNYRGYHYFVRQVLPLTQQRTPNFCLQVTGTFYYHMTPEPHDGIMLGGFVPDLVPYYETARFAICPVTGGTGQQIKIVEAMAHGLPVVALRGAAEKSLLVHSETGMIANNAEQFAAYVSQLWQDRDLCRRMGHAAARESIAAQAKEHLVERALAQMLNLSF